MLVFLKPNKSIQTSPPINQNILYICSYLQKTLKSLTTTYFTYSFTQTEHKSQRGQEYKSQLRPEHKLSKNTNIDTAHNSRTQKQITRTMELHRITNTELN